MQQLRDERQDRWRELQQQLKQLGRGLGVPLCHSRDRTWNFIHKMHDRVRYGAHYRGSHEATESALAGLMQMAHLNVTAAEAVVERLREELKQAEKVARQARSLRAELCRVQETHRKVAEGAAATAAAAAAAAAEVKAASHADADEAGAAEPEAAEAAPEAGADEGSEGSNVISANNNVCGGNGHVSGGAGGDSDSGSVCGGHCNCPSGSGYGGSSRNGGGNSSAASSSSSSSSSNTGRASVRGTTQQLARQAKLDKVKQWLTGLSRHLGTLHIGAPLPSVPPSDRVGAFMQRMEAIGEQLREGLARAAADEKVSAHRPQWLEGKELFNPCFKPAALKHLRAAVQALMSRPQGHPAALVILKGHCPCLTHTFTDIQARMVEDPEYGSTTTWPTERMLVALEKAAGLDPRLTFALNLQLLCPGLCYGLEVNDQGLLEASRKLDIAVVEAVQSCLGLEVVLIFVGKQALKTLAATNPDTLLTRAHGSEANLGYMPIIETTSAAADRAALIHDEYKEVEGLHVGAIPHPCALQYLRTQRDAEAAVSMVLHVAARMQGSPLASDEPDMDVLRAAQYSGGAGGGGGGVGRPGCSGDSEGCMEEPEGDAEGRPIDVTVHTDWVLPGGPTEEGGAQEQPQEATAESGQAPEQPQQAAAESGGAQEQPQQAAAGSGQAPEQPQQAAAEEGGAEEQPQQAAAEEGGAQEQPQQAAAEGAGAQEQAQQGAEESRSGPGHTVVVDGTFYSRKKDAAAQHELVNGGRTDYSEIIRRLANPTSGWLAVKTSKDPTAGAGVVIANKYFASIEEGQDWLVSLELSNMEAALSQGLEGLPAAADQRWAFVESRIAQDNSVKTWRFCYVSVVPPEQVALAPPPPPAEAEE